MKVRTERFHELSAEALQNSFLRRAIATANRSFQASRATAIEDLPEWEALREHGRDVKHRAIEHLPQALEEFERRFTARGGCVHWAEDATQACEVVTSIIGDAGSARSRRAVKSKSMTTEEIGLNAWLEARGIDVVESDLGEYIVQLAGETPSHIITPAIHKSRHDIAKLLAEKIGSPPDADIPTMTRAARAALREWFQQAGVGITGANFVVAETGTVVIVENEGNARMTTTLPDVHIAIVGIEKIVPRLEDLAPLLRLLCRSATGQRITSYASFISGPRTTFEDGSTEPDGPREVHVVFLDAGRSAIWADPVAREALRCIRCGACLNFCPVYERIGGHAYGWVYPGPIGSVITPRYVGDRRAMSLPRASSLCGRCAEVCPVRIPLPELLLENRARAVEAGGAPPTKRLAMVAFRRLARSPRLWRAALAVGRAFAPLVRQSGLARVLPGPLRAWTRHREMPTADGPSFRARWRRTNGFRETEPRDGGSR